MRPRDIMSRGVLLIKAFFGLWAVMLAAGISVRSILTPFLFAASVLLFDRAKKAVRPVRMAPLRAAAALYAAATALAVYGHAAAAFDSRLFRAGVLFLLLVGIYLVARGVLIVLAGAAGGARAEQWMLRSADEAGNDPENAAERAEAFFLRHTLSISFVVCVLCYLPWFLYSWPGIFSPDPINQIEQVLGMEPLSNHHPVAHTLLIGLWMRVGGIFTRDVSAQLSVYTFFQMTFFAFAAAVVVRTLAHTFRLRTSVCLLALAFYALLPFMAVFSVLVGKDTVFASVVMLFVCVLAELLRFGLPDGTGRGLRRGAAFFLFGILLCLLRTNGWYAFLVFSLCFFITCRGKRMRTLALTLPVIAVAALLRGPVMDACQVRQPDLAESLHIPMQQIAQVLVNDRPISAEERALIESVVDTTYIHELYVPGYADNIKELIRAGHPEVLEADRLDYLRLWLRLGLRYPGDYLSAWAAQIRGITWPAADHEVATIEGVYPNAFGLEYRPVIGGAALVKLRELAMKLGSFVPLYGLLWSAGFWSWLLLSAGALILSQGENRRRLLLLVPGAAIFCTLLVATPIAGEFRYAFPIVALAPFDLCALLGASLRSVE